MAIIICGFSGVGKSYIAQTYNDFIDLESSGYKTKDFPKNYINEVERIIQEDDDEISYILLSCHAEVRAELQNRGIKYILVTPYRESKNEYLKRWLKRGENIDFISKMNKNWNDMVTSCYKDNSPHIYLQDDEYLSDILI